MSKSDVMPIGKIKRASMASFAIAGVGVQQLGHLSKRPFLSKKKAIANKEKVDAKNAKTIFAVLSQLRGTALKVAQMLSLETTILPEQYRKELAKSYHQVPPLNRALIRKVIINELGDAPEKVFANFDNQAFAAASLGQVHTATSFTGQKMAIKVQYPGIDKTISNDLQLVRQLTRALPDREMIIRVLSEIKERMQEETNYVLEAENMHWFADNLGMNQVVVPEVYPEWSNKHLLCMEHIEGMHLKDWLATNPSQVERNHFAQLIYDLYIHSIFELHCFHADPNPGNYIFRQDGSLGLIDFGCVKRITPIFSKQVSILYKSMVHKNHRVLLETYDKLGMLKCSDNKQVSKEYYKSVLQPFDEWLSQTFENPSFSFSEQGGYADKGFKLLNNMRKHRGSTGGFIELNTDFVFTDRTLYGVYKIFEQMGATIRMQNKWTC
ncbi:MAG: AarF/ABC1/UbiB kinase family protein [Mariprofundales bacterium]